MTAEGQDPVTAALEPMVAALRRGDAVFHPSKFWEMLNAQNVEQLRAQGVDNLKRTLAQNYFTWNVGYFDSQFRSLLRRLRPADWAAVFRAARPADPTVPASRHRQAQLALFTQMLWRYTCRKDADGLLRNIPEPEYGNPPDIRLGGRLISQDLANSVLEYYSMREHWTPSVDHRDTVCELGAGYGRNAYVVLKAHPNVRYVVVDVPPALYVSQTYLTTVLPDRRAFKFRDFTDYQEVREELEQADVAFLLPHQAQLLPDDFARLFVNISSLHEMTSDQIQHYLLLIGRLTSGFFYTKQWKVSRNTADGFTIRAGEYPIPTGWRTLYHRQAAVQSEFFEAMYAVP